MAADPNYSKYSQIITLDNLNTVYRSIQDDIKALLQVYDTKGDIKWVEFIKQNKVNKGVVYTLQGITDYIAANSNKPDRDITKDPPISLRDGENLLCIKTIDFKSATVANPDKPGETITNTEKDHLIFWGLKEDLDKYIKNNPAVKGKIHHWTEYWKEIGNVMHLADAISDGYLGCRYQKMGGNKIIFPSSAFLEKNGKYNPDAISGIAITNTSKKTQITQDSIYVGMPYDSSEITLTEKDKYGNDIKVLKGDSIEEIVGPQVCTGTLNVYNGEVNVGREIEGVKGKVVLSSLDVTNSTTVGNLDISGGTLTSESNISIKPTNVVTIKNLTVNNDALVGSLQMGSSELKSTHDITLTGTDPKQTSSLGQLTVTDTTTVKSLGPTTGPDGSIGSINLKCSETDSIINISSKSSLGKVNISGDVGVNNYNTEAKKFQIKDGKGSSIGTIQSSDEGTINISKDSILGKIKLSTDTVESNTYNAEAKILTNTNGTIEADGKGIITISPGSNLGKVNVSGTTTLDTYNTNGGYLTNTNGTIEATGAGTIYVTSDSKLGKINVANETGTSILTNTGGTIDASNCNITITTGSDLKLLTVTTDTNTSTLTNTNGTIESKDAGTINVSADSNLGKVNLTPDAAADTYNATTSTLTNTNGTINATGTIKISDGSNLGSLQATSATCSSLNANAIKITEKDPKNNYLLVKSSCIIGDPNASSVPKVKLGTTNYIDTNVSCLGVWDANDPKGEKYAALTAYKVFNAVWNDIADAIEINIKPEPGYCYFFDGKGYNKTGKYCQKGIIGIHSDTYGYLAGSKDAQYELNAAVAGFVLAHVDKEYESGTPLTSTKDGKLTKMKKKDLIFHPERCVGTYWKPEPENNWNGIDVNGRHWIKVK